MYVRYDFVVPDLDEHVLQARTGDQVEVVRVDGRLNGRAVVVLVYLTYERELGLGRILLIRLVENVARDRLEISTRIQ